MMPKSKRCTKCKVEKLLEEFNKQKPGKFGRGAQCKVCMAEYREANREQRRQYLAANRERLSEQKRQYNEANREKISEQRRRYREGNREKIAEQKRRYYEANREKISEKERRYYEENRERIAERCSQYNGKNSERIAAQKRQYYEANREQIVAQKRQYNEANREKRSEWRRQNPEKGAANCAKRKAAKLNRTPAWSDLEHIKLFYEARQAISEATGKEYHVDHMIPLRGKTVSGLHVPGNLQIIPAERNMSKKNRF